MMITSYVDIHIVEEFEGQTALDQERAEAVSAVADRHGVFTRRNPDGDTIYLEGQISLESLALSAPGEPKVEDPSERARWSAYVSFLKELEESTVGYLLHEADTAREKALLEMLLPGGGDHRTLSYVDVAYRRAH